MENSHTPFGLIALVIGLVGVIATAIQMREHSRASPPKPLSEMNPALGYYSPQQTLVLSVMLIGLGVYFIKREWGDILGQIWNW